MTNGDISDIAFFGFVVTMVVLIITSVVFFSTLDEEKIVKRWEARCERNHGEVKVDKAGQSYCTKEIIL